jgi:UPF0042 nucleotide-binding protein
LAGSGKSTALRALEDMGLYAVDNLPVQLLPAFVELPLEKQGGPFKAALVMDPRSPRFVEKFPTLYDDLLERGYALDLVFLEAADEVLIRRFSQTRRRHPLAGGGGAVVADIRREREMLKPLKARAGHVLDTSRLNVHQLRGQMHDMFTDLAPPARLDVNLVSFGFKFGLPSEADLVMDVRFLANPYFVEDLQPLDGLDRRVADYIFSHEDAGVFLKRFMNLLDFLIPRNLQEGKSRLTIAIGCTGGRHRSVAVSRWLAERIDLPQCRVSLRHRDLEQA